MTGRLGFLTLVAFMLAACTSAAERTELTVFAAASLGPVLDRLAPLYEATHPGTRIVVATDSSAALRTQIEQGAPADVFLSADTANPQRLSDAGLTAGAPIHFAGNDLTVIVPLDNPAAIDSARDLGNAGVRVIAAGDEVPITRYALEVVGNLGIEAAYRANVASREDNVRAVVAKIELGEGDAAIVYATDARGSANVRAMEIPPTANVTATYAGVVVGPSERPAEARAFLDWLVSDEAQAILADLGFSSPPA
jgi:molybdate transport system substrate-binding protein